MPTLALVVAVITLSFFSLYALMFIIFLPYIPIAPVLLVMNCHGFCTMLLFKRGLFNIFAGEVYSWTKLISKLLTTAVDMIHSHC